MCIAREPRRPDPRLTGAAETLAPRRRRKARASAAMRGRVDLIAFLALIAMRGMAVAADPVLPLPDEDERAIAANLGPGVVGKALPAPVIADTGSYFPLVERERVYKVTVGEKAGQ